MTITPEILDAMIESLEWMIKCFKWSHKQAGLGGGYSPELQKAIDLLDFLKKLKMSGE